MKRLAVLLALLPLTVFGAMSGEWRASVQATNATTHQKYEIAIYATLTQDGSTLTGTAGSAGALVPIQNASVNGATLNFSVQEGSKPPAPPLRTAFVLTPSGANLVGTVTLWTGEIVNVTMTPVRGK